MDDRIREPAPYEAPNPPKKMLDQATSHLQMLGAIDLDGFNQWVIHNPGGVCVLMQALLDRLPIPTREAMIQSIAAQSVAQGGEWQKCYSAIIKALAAMVNVHTPDKLFDPNAIPRDPVMDQITRIKIAIDAYSKDADRATTTPATGSGGDAVGCLTISRWRGVDAMVNHDFDYYGNLPNGSYSLYTHPATAGGDAGGA